MIDLSESQVGLALRVETDLMQRFSPAEDAGALAIAEVGQLAAWTGLLTTYIHKFGATELEAVQQIEATDRLDIALHAFGNAAHGSLAEAIEREARELLTAIEACAAFPLGHA